MVATPGEVARRIGIVIRGCVSIATFGACGAILGIANFSEEDDAGSGTDAKATASVNDPGDRVGNQYAIYNCDYPIGSGVCANIARVGTTRREPASGVSSTWRERSGSGTWTGT